MLTNGEGDDEGGGDGDGKSSTEAEGNRAAGDESIKDKKDARRAATTGSVNTETREETREKQKTVTKG
ncbi:hypothetical protein E4U57_003654 [Claviceps arundinis]|uniref:Uncharacterized protein n=1 Tax=Claviceps arundinis TaxID=1623583 RepID=A0ABQ7P6C1_9HYPO|nr:hypothetical protein E4U57_003654 [Claviceps arundinis]